MVNKKYIGFGIVGLLALAAVVLAIGLISPQIQSVDDKGKWIGTVCVAKNGVSLGCTHNLLVDQGKNYIEEMLSGIDKTTATPGTDFAKYISLSTNTSSPAASWTVLPNELTGSGLARAVADNCADNGIGNWSCWKTFTATGTVTGIHLAGLNWDGTSGANTLVAANALSTDVNLEANDQLTVNWTISIS